MGALLPHGNETLRDYVDSFLAGEKWRNDLFFVLSERHLGVKRPASGEKSPSDPAPEPSCD